MNLVVLNMSSFQQGVKGNKQKKNKIRNFMSIFKCWIKDACRTREIFTVNVQQAIFMGTPKYLTFRQQ
jgi:hypothetical protein